MSFDYYYGMEAEGFSFYRIPRVLVTDPFFHGLSTDAKLLYGLMLDRMGLSLKNGWYDDQGRVYIYYTVEEIREAMNCGHVKAGRLLAELDTDKGIGLIERIKQGQGKPTIIYVLKFTPPTMDNCAHFRPTKTIRPDISKAEVKTSTFDRSRPIKAIGADLQKMDASYIDNNHTDWNQTYMSYTDPSIYPSLQEVDLGQMDRWTAREHVKAQMEYSILIDDYRGDPLLDAMADLITDVLRSNAPTERINGAAVPMEDVQNGFRKLTRDHIVYVIDAMKKTAPDVTNLRAYLLTALYNALRTIEAHYDAAVRHDFR